MWQKISIFLIILFAWNNSRAGNLKIGIASVDMTPVIGVPLAGYGSSKRRPFWLYDFFNSNPYANFLRPSTGKLDAIRSKAIILSGENGKLLFLSLDLIGISENLFKDIKRRISSLGFKESELFISATHTHNGPGSLTKNKFLAILAADSHNEEVYEDLLKKITQSIEQAHSNLQDGLLFYSSFQAKGLQKNRRQKIGHFDSTANILYLKNKENNYLGALINLPLHATSLGSSVLKFSADSPGFLERKLEKGLEDKNAKGLPRPIVAFINGAEGDVAPAIDGLNEKQYGQLDKMGESFLLQAMNALPMSRPISPKWVATKENINLGQAQLNLNLCTKQSWISHLLFFDINFELPFSHETSLSVLKLGDLTLMTWPGEPTTTMGNNLKKIASELGHKNLWILGLTNDHKMYFTSKEEYAEGTYEACASFYGVEGGQKILDAHKVLLKSLKHD